MSFLYNTQVGIRHLIFLIPLVCILCSSVVPELKANYQKIILGIHFCVSRYQCSELLEKLFSLYK